MPNAPYSKPLVAIKMKKLAIILIFVPFLSFSQKREGYLSIEVESWGIIEGML